MASKVQPSDETVPTSPRAQTDGDPKPPEKVSEKEDTHLLVNVPTQFAKGYAAIDDTGRLIEHDFRTTVLDCRQTFGVMILLFELADVARTTYYLYRQFDGPGLRFFTEDEPYDTLPNTEAVLGVGHVIAFNYAVWYLLEYPVVFLLLNIVEALISLIAVTVMILMITQHMQWSAFDFVFQIFALLFTAPNAYFAYLVSSGNMPLDNRTFVM